MWSEVGGIWRWRYTVEFRGPRCKYLVEFGGGGQRKLEEVEVGY